MKYVFILGHNPRLSVAEIKAILPRARIVKETDSFLILSLGSTQDQESSEFDCPQMMRQLGGTVKIGVVMAEKVDMDLIVNDLIQNQSAGKLRFGISYYKSKAQSQKSKVSLKFGLEIKRKLKEHGVKSRLVTSREPVLSSVVITKNKCQEFLILPFGDARDNNDAWLAKTCAVQEFEEYSRRDYGRPVRDVLSGTMPPKLAKIMINLAQLKSDVRILDPFCGSGTILQEAILLGYENVMGCDVSKKAVKDTEKNLKWLFDKSKVQSQRSKVKLKVFKCDVRRLGDGLEHNSVDAIITEPYLGPPLRGRESLKKLQQIIKELSELYLDAFEEFKKVLKPGGKVVIIFPVFLYKKQRKALSADTSALSALVQLGWKQLNREELIYGRPGQKVMREVFVFKKN
jgi:tRNA G10  N-methylase Trm11